MSRNGSGTYVLPATSFSPAVSGATIESSANNTLNNDFAAALTQSISKDGQTPWTGNDNHSGFKIINLGDGSTSTDAMAYGQGAKLAGGNTFTGNQTINGSVSLSGDLTVTGTVIFTTGTITIGNLSVTSVASVASLHVTGTSNLNILNVASVASLNTLNVASVASIGTLRVASSVVIGTASGGSKGTGTLNATGIFINGQSVSTTGVVIQIVKTETGAVATGSTVIPLDDSIPQITEGDQYMTLAITPTSAANKLRIDVVLFAASSSAFNLMAALFQDATAGALAGGIENFRSNNQIQGVEFTHHMTAGTTSATTFRVRAGDSGASTLTFNGIGGARIFGGVMASSITITEYT